MSESHESIPRIQEKGWFMEEEAALHFLEVDGFEHRRAGQCAQSVQDAVQTFYEMLLFVGWDGTPVFNINAIEVLAIPPHLVPSSNYALRKRKWSELQDAAGVLPPAHTACHVQPLTHTRLPSCDCRCLFITF
mgnify:CR=1 FL=1